MAKSVTGIDVGSRTAIALRGEVKGNTFAVSHFAVAPGGYAELAQAMTFKPGAARVGLSGPELNIRYTRVPRVPDWQLRKLMRFEVEEVGGSSGSEVASDYNVLPEMPEIEGEDVVLLSMAKESMLEMHVDGMADLGGKLEAATPNAIGLYNAWLRFGVLLDDTVLVANIGHQNIDVIIARGQDLVFARSLGGGSKLFDEALSERFGVPAAKAEALKKKLVDLSPDARHADANGEKASRACMGPAGQLLGLLSSTVMFSKSQVKLGNLKLDRVMICGGGAALPGLDRYLSRGLSVPVERFDPFGVVDIAKLAPDQEALLEEYALESVVALGLATSASDPEAYAIEIVPAAIQKQRAFMGGTAFLIAAGVLAIGSLGYTYYGLSQEHDEVAGQVARVNQKYSAANRAHTEAKRLVEENEALSERATQLFMTAGMGAELERVIQGLDANMPKDFWIQRFVAESTVDEELGISRSGARPLIKVEGQTREGVDRTNERFVLLVDALRDWLPRAELRDSLSPGGERFLVKLSSFVQGQEGVPQPAEAPTEEE